MNEFTAKYQDQIRGVLSGFDRLVFRGSPRRLSYAKEMEEYLWQNGVLFKNLPRRGNLWVTGGSALGSSEEVVELSTGGIEGALLLLGIAVMDERASIFADGF